MLFSRLFSLSVTSVATALNFPAPTQAPEKRDMKDCYKVLAEESEALSAVPSVGADMIEFLGQQTQLLTVTDNCLIPSVTGSLAPQYTSWQKSASKWQLEHITAVHAIQSACSDVIEDMASGLGLPVKDGMLGTATACTQYYFETEAAKSAAVEHRTGGTVLAAIIATRDEEVKARWDDPLI
ncbi:unnamed protein product [Clonostachys rosea f. rosea IK726]|uniref:Uncharacterized protein n=1 Tax=Clonostachys rosea f. rosea IK726 TaxID=1349383 RepID=A0ACA9TJ24_BIOOC|nr:unnamed protein product [Clonostachys rosea f. rosea IK726]